MRLENVIRERAKENQVKAMEIARKNNPNNTEEQFNLKSDETVKPITTNKELAKIAGVGHDTIDKIKAIEKDAKSLIGSILLICYQ